MKMLIVNTVSFHLNGVTSVIMNYYRNMDCTDMQIDFAVTNGIAGDFRRELEVNGAFVYDIPRNTNPIKYMYQMYRLLKNGHYDLIHVHGNSATMLFDVLPAAFAHTPVRIVHSHNTTCSHKTLHKLLTPLFRRCYTHGFACGEDAGRWLYGKHPFTVLKNGVELVRYRYDSASREEYRQKLGAGDRTVIGHVGNFIEQKNHVFLLDWYAELVKEDDRFLLLLIGEGVLFDEMQRKCATLGLQDSVRFLGKSSEVAQYMQAMDVFVLPSLHEGFPVVLVEAQAAGLPCLVADTVAREADLTDSLRFLPIDDTAPWVSALKQTEVAMSQRAARCTDWQRRIAVAGYDVAANADRMKGFYDAFCNQRKKGQTV